jgi:hypothetical protein
MFRERSDDDESALLSQLYDVIIINYTYNLLFGKYLFLLKYLSIVLRPPCFMFFISKLMSFIQVKTKTNLLLLK